VISTQDPDGRDALLQRDARLAELPLHVTDALFQVVAVGGRRGATHRELLEEALRLVARLLELRRAHGRERRQPGQHAGRHRRPDEDAYTYSGAVGAHARYQSFGRVDRVHRFVRGGRELISSRFELINKFRHLVV
jgi:hypothetical protein